MELVTQKQINNFWNKVLFTTDCWEWQASLDKDGYGYYSTKIGKRAHRFSYLIHKGKLDPNLQIDHLCKNKSCVNPDHLEQVTCRENLKRAETQISTINSKKTNCKRGHLFSGYNLIVKKTGKRTCRTCNNMTNNIRRRKQYNDRKEELNLLRCVRRWALNLLSMEVVI